MATTDGTLQGTCHKDDVSKALFLRLDPILRMILASIEQYNKLNNEKSSQEERILGLLRTQTKLLHVLKNELITSRNDSDDPKKLSEGLVVLAEYIILPIVVILERGHTSSAGTVDSLAQNQNQEQKTLVRRSLDRKCVTGAADTLSTFANCFKVLQQQSDNSETQGTSTAGLPPRIVVRCLIACTVALPDEVYDTRAAAGSVALDKGEETTIAILNCIESLVSVPPSDGAEGSLANEVSKALEGALVARMVHCCVSILASASDSPSTTRGGGDNALSIQSVTTLLSLMDNVQEKSTWKTVFPGCFAALYRFTLSRLRLSPSSPRGAAESLGALTRLLCLTLTPPDNKSGDNTLVLEKIRSLTLSGDRTALGTKSQSNGEEEESNKVRMPTSSPDSVSKTDNSFEEEINSRLPAPIMVLLNALSIAQSASIRLAVTDFCRSILVDVGGEWANENAKQLELKAMECCLVLTKDSDPRVVASSRKALQDYQSFLGPPCWANHLNSQVVPQIIIIFEELPAILQSGREVELRARLQLVSGYLDLALNNLGDSCRAATSSNEGLVSTSLAAEGVSSPLRRTLAELFDMDFDSLHYSPAITSAAAIKGTGETTSHGPIRFRFRYMSDETATVAKDVVRTLGRALGPKHGASFVDACIADLLDSFAGSDSRSLDWFHKWVGCVVAANEVLLGAYEPPTANGSDSTRKERRRKRVLKSLASSVLPVISSSPLWDITTTVSDVATVEKTNERSRSNLLQIDLNEYKSNPVVPYSSRGSQMSASALRGGALMVCMLVRLIETFAQLLQRETESFLSLLLYPLFERASSNNHSQVQRAAVQALDCVATVCEMTSITDLVTNYSDYLFGSLLSRLRAPGGSVATQTIYQESLPGVVEVILRHAITPKEISEGDNQRRSLEVLSLQDRTNISYVIQVIGSVVASFDYCSRRTGSTTYQAPVSHHDIVKMFDAAMYYLCGCYGIEMDSSRDPDALFSPASHGTSEEPWLNVLARFRVEDTFIDEHEEELTPEEGFAKHHADVEKADSESPGSVAPPVTSEEVEFVNLVLTRSCFFLAIPSLKVQVSSCDTWLHAFQFLGSFASFTKTEEENKLATTILRSISESWPSILARLKDDASSVFRAKSSTIVSLRSLRPKISLVDGGGMIQMTLLSRLLDLVASLCELSGDFMVSRFRDDVWPLVTQLLGSCVETATKRPRDGSKASGGGKDLAVKPGIEKRHTRPDSAHTTTALLDVLELLSRAYTSDCGQGLSEFVPLAGTMILPLLGVDGEIRSVAIHTLKCMLVIDSCSLWRALLTVSGRGLQRRPLNPQESSRDPDQSTHELTLQMEGAQELVSFVESLPEQPLG